MIHRLLTFHKALGVVFIALLLLGVWASYGIFTKKFAEYEEITLQAGSIGLQLPARADVKVRGVIVGEVLEMDPGGADDAMLTLGIYPDELDTIPAGVTGAIVPKTLFGEKYVSLKIPDGTDTSGPAIRAGAVIDETELAVEVEQVLTDIYPLLRAVRPADLNVTLTALATALEGRGEALGENLTRLDSYLKRFNPQIPALLEDLRLTAETSDIYADILPEVATILDNTVKTTQTLEGREGVLNQFLRDTDSFASTARGFLDRNGDLIERFGNLSVRQLRLLSKYSPIFPCVTEGLVGASDRLSEAFRGYELHIILEPLPNQPRKWTPQDQQRFADTRGPDCAELPNPPFSQEGDNFRKSVPDFNDGVDEPTGKGTQRVAPGFSEGYTGTGEDMDVLRSLLEEHYDVPGSDLGVALAGPLATGGDR
ncbi:MCE family protein [Nocardioides panacisoli]|uniref:MCE family protein n=1 Tax=Nocardioides panacisoli TaxID=627624 RepID=UPI001C63586F|nr:MCE family protein [Nocardioides panacisoli]QYJ03846.1 MCE family protein [Nocardioides panacisoli]